MKIAGLRQLHKFIQPVSFLPHVQRRNVHWSNAKSILPSQNYRVLVYTGLVIVGGLGTLAFHRQRLSMDMSPPSSKGASHKNLVATNTKSEDVKYFSREEVRKHSKKSTGIWVTFGTHVYDITEFVESHPGGDKILLAAGGSVEPFWKVYTIHDSGHVRQQLAQYLIGELDPKDSSKDEKPADLNDPFANEPDRHPALVVRSQRPFNAETTPSLLVEQDVTPNEFFYVRHHLAVPLIKDPSSFRLEVSLAETPSATDKEQSSKNIISLSLADLKTLPSVDITATLQCAGNRRSEMKVVGPIQGLEWDRGAIGNAVWRGVRLMDVLKRAGLAKPPPNVKHLQFEGADGYGASIPIHTAFNGEADVILAYEMNGEELPRDHGYPLRVIVPGTVAARSVKWLQRIVLSGEESRSHWQRNDYKGFCPSVNWDQLNWNDAVSIQEMPVQSAILEPDRGSVVAADEDSVTIRGYAWSGGGRGILRVDVSADGGKTWAPAQLLSNDAEADDKRRQKWSWTRWEKTLPIPKGSEKLELVCKAVDSSYNVQPDSAGGIYNRRGVLNNAWSRFELERDNKAQE